MVSEAAATHLSVSSCVGDRHTQLTHPLDVEGQEGGCANRLTTAANLAKEGLLCSQRPKKNSLSTKEIRKIEKSGPSRVSDADPWFTRFLKGYKEQHSDAFGQGEGFEGRCGSLSCCISQSGSLSNAEETRETGKREGNPFSLPTPGKAMALECRHRRCFPGYQWRRGVSLVRGSHARGRKTTTTTKKEEKPKNGERKKMGQDLKPVVHSLANSNSSHPRSATQSKRGRERVHVCHQDDRQADP